MLVEKIFNWSDRLYKSIFKGSPHLFTAQDFNRYLDVIREFQIKTQNNLGGVAVNFEIVIDDTFFSLPPSGSNTIQDEFHYFRYKIVKIDNAIEHGMLFNGILYAIPLQENWVTKRITANLESPNLEILNTQNPNIGTLLADQEKLRILEGYFYLVATFEKVVFNNPNPVLHISEPKKFSGVSGTSLPTELPSADNYIWGNERIVFVDKNNTSLSISDQLNLNASTASTTDEKVVAIIGTLRQDFKGSLQDSELFEQNLDSNGVVETENPIFTTSDKVVKTNSTKNYLKLFYNIEHPKNKLSTFSGFRLNKTQNLESGKISKALHVKNYLTNNSVIEKLNHFYWEYLAGQGFQDLNIAKIVKSYYSLKSSHETLERNSNANFQDIFAYIQGRTVSNTSWTVLEPSQYKNGASVVVPQREVRFDFTGESGAISSTKANPSLRYKKINKESVVFMGVVLAPTSVIGNQNYVSIFRLPLGFRPQFDTHGSVETYVINRQNSRMLITTEGEVLLSNLPSGLTDPIYVYCNFLV